MGKTKKLSIVMPCYNEKNSVEKIIAEVMDVDLGTTKKEIIMIDDGSKDGTRDILKKLAAKHDNIKLVFNEKNMGKGASLRKGILQTTGDVVVIQDADLEYDPQEYKRLLYPIERGHADVVYGSRFIGGQPHRLETLAGAGASRLFDGFEAARNGCKRAP